MPTCPVLTGPVTLYLLPPLVVAWLLSNVTVDLSSVNILECIAPTVVALLPRVHNNCMVAITFRH